MNECSSDCTEGGGSSLAAAAAAELYASELEAAGHLASMHCGGREGSDHGAATPPDSADIFFKHHDFGPGPPGN